MGKEARKKREIPFKGPALAPTANFATTEVRGQQNDGLTAEERTVNPELLKFIGGQKHFKNQIGASQVA